MANLTPEEVQELAVCISNKLFLPVHGATTKYTNKIIAAVIEEYISREEIMFDSPEYKIGCYDDEEGIITYPDRGC